MIRIIEELSMNAWPAMQTLHYDGWILRSTEGYTKRANSVYPLYETELDMDEKIGYCEAFFRDQGLPTVFKMTSASTPSDLDAHLEARGYRTDSITSVQTLYLYNGQFKVKNDASLTSTDTDEWHTAFACMNNVSAARRATHERILRAILPDKCYASIIVDGRIIGCGLGVFQAGYLGIFDIIIDADHCGQGYGTQLMTALLAWGQERGANKAYLQVMCNNEPALRLYKKLRFQEQYRYWYRITP